MGNMVCLHKTREQEEQHLRIHSECSQLCRLKVNAAGVVPMPFILLWACLGAGIMLYYTIPCFSSAS